MAGASMGFSSLDTFSNDASYYISVFIKVNHRQTDRERMFFYNLMQKINSVMPHMMEAETRIYQGQQLRTQMWVSQKILEHLQAQEMDMR